jgi:hypothetical protein
VVVCLPAGELQDRLATAAGQDSLATGDPVVVVEGVVSFAIPPLLPVVVVGEGGDLGGGSVDAVVATVTANPQASVAFVTLLRASGGDVAAGLLAESAVYGALQGGPEFAAWRAANPARSRSGGVPLRVARDGDELRITLCQPSVRNAFDAAMRDALAEALAVADADPSLRVVLDGEGPCFCAGGHLDEFGSRPDPATAHLVRLARSVPWLLHGLRSRVHAVVHGPCRGSGIELPAFAGRVTAHPDTTFGLPELRMGLVPGAGGTVSLSRRIGRERTAWLGLTGSPIDAPTALAWGLVDVVAG